MKYLTKFSALEGVSMVARGKEKCSGEEERKRRVIWAVQGDERVSQRVNISDKVGVG